MGNEESALLRSPPYLEEVSLLFKFHLVQRVSLLVYDDPKVKGHIAVMGTCVQVQPRHTSDGYFLPSLALLVQLKAFFDTLLLLFVVSEWPTRLHKKL